MSNSNPLPPVVPDNPLPDQPEGVLVDSQHPESTAGKTSTGPITLAQVDRLAASLQACQPEAGTQRFDRKRLAQTQPQPLVTVPRALRGPWALLAILVVQAALSLRLIRGNTAFQDEALYLWAGHLEWLHWMKGIAIPQFATYFSGSPVVYPPIGAVADGFGGLAGARLLSTGFMLITTVLLWATGRRMFGQRAGLAAAGIFGVLGVVQFLGAFATYDAMALCLLALASYLTVRAQGWPSELLLMTAAIVLTAANATKYASALWDPVVISLAGLGPANRDWVLSVLRTLRLAVYTAACITIGLKFGGHSYVQGILFTTISRQAQGVPASVGMVLRDSFDWVGIVLIFALVGLGAVWKRGTRQRLLIGVLILAALLAPAEQARLHTTVALHKHVAFGAWFAAIAAGYAISRASQVHQSKGWRIGLAAIIFTAVLGALQVNSMFFKGWPDTTSTNAALAEEIPKVGCPCLLSDYTIAEYYLNIQSNFSQITGPYGFDYWSYTLHKELHGMTAYQQALKEHYFTIIQLDPGASSDLYNVLQNELKKTPGYVLTGKFTDSFTPLRPLEIWEYRP